MLQSSGVAVTGVGHKLGSLVEDNETLCRNLDITPEWIIEKTGIERRYLAAPDETASGLSLAAARDAMASAGIDASQIDLIVCCTFSADYRFPALASKIHLDLGVKGGQMMDVQANCAGFVTGLTVASDRMRLDPELRNALVIGVELNSRFISRSNADAAIYHSDGAGAVVLSRIPDAGIVSSAFHTDSSNYEAVRVRGGGSTFTRPDRAFDPAIDTMELNGIATWKQAITHLPTVIRRASEKAGLNYREADFFVFHQANLRLIEYLVRKMGGDMSKTYTNVGRIGNTGAASTAIALSEAVERGRLKAGDVVIFAAVGAGFSFGASVWRWADVKAVNSDPDWVA
ncbi:3-oxoacyl-ACP synthase III family protein [Methylorubrum extorquens]|uniref:3-oxoacyl-ACP synthase III family protein n=1 Tax=Methylorubrum extorquens TaxID=408 RepID=UPI001EE6366F|nr:ketoacyl-ACP synthase III [Methylorubrum extorquens]MCG5247842.1 ketoacyl-ACP synthase III [Methylorubrum extorquens]